MFESRKGKTKWIAIAASSLLLGMSAFMQVTASTPNAPPGCDTCWTCPNGYGGIGSGGSCIACCDPP
ncbi:hypothetical protein [Lysobacter sp. Root983]|uniref:hypothetical protein n=1 Tax=Lysobacter sp. Root983 TaxID=1736613 RepID=UPI000AB988C5|nr:hypothetical protein [Lysobacter sp. Root983]